MYSKGNHLVQFRTYVHLLITVIFSVLFIFSSSISAQEVIFPPRIERAVISASEKHDLPAKYIFAMILVENDEFNPYLRSKTRDSGITQINDALLEDFYSAGFEDVYDIEENIEFGTMRLKWAFDKYQNWHQAYMVYNMGEGRAKKLFKQGIYESRYSRKAMRKLSNRDNWILENPSAIGRKYEIIILPGLLAQPPAPLSQEEKSLGQIKSMTISEVLPLEENKETFSKATK